MKRFYFLFLLFFFGCETTFVGNQLRLEMSAPQQAVLLIVDNNKTVSYGGGLNAVEGKTTWQGDLDGNQQQEFEQLINTSGWLLNPPKTDDNKGTGHYKIRIRRDEIDNKFTVPLTNNNATSIYSFLMNITRVQFEPYLEKLPKPNMDVLIERKLKP
ncbi:MAG: hypothetical protein QF718_03530 [Phycisphaerales bacterium]|jgi:hypothetical protein|nr:hypothetical protein [Phycisphaerales bacterium]